MKNFRLLKYSFFCLYFLLLYLAPQSVALTSFRGDGVLTFKNLHLGDTLTVHYRDRRGHYQRHALSAINFALRCRLTNQVKQIPVDLLELIDQIEDHFNSSEIDVVSAYRSPTLNEVLRRSGRKVASKSLHMQAMAMDIRLPGVDTKKLRDYALSLQRGGVGYYPGNRFVHVDIGRVRRW